MLEREIRDFMHLTKALQRDSGCSMEQAKQHAGQFLGCQVPSEAAFNAVLVAPGVRRRRGRQPRSELTKRDAVGAVAAYFESIGALPEQAINEAQRWLGIKLSRRVAKEGMARFKANTSPGQFKIQASWAYATFKRGTTLPLPEVMWPTPRKTRVKSDLG